MKTFRPIPAQSVCARCANLFVYFRLNKPRSYCAPCVPLEKIDSNNFYNHQTALKRLLGRRNAIEAHAHV